MRVYGLLGQSGSILYATRKNEAYKLIGSPIVLFDWWLSSRCSVIRRT